LTAIAVSGIAIDRKRSVSRTKLSVSTKAMTSGSQLALTAIESRASAGAPPTNTRSALCAEGGRHVVLAQAIDRRRPPGAARLDGERHGRDGDLRAALHRQRASGEVAVAGQLGAQAGHALLRARVPGEPSTTMVTGSVAPLGKSRSSASSPCLATVLSGSDDVPAAPSCRPSTGEASASSSTSWRSS
jgi:hypothetical protein